ncbi:MAG TPA: hypothetical protein VFS00_28380, partial [Polyangiaceae bacterium]|nr:hypothetical protein [Polyangiaceae bacterium]
AGVVILTNVRNGGEFEQLPFNAAVRHELLETLFGASKPVAAAQVGYFARAKRAAAARAREGLERRPDPAWAKGLEGTYAEPDLGKVRLRAGAAGGTFDAGEWQSAFGRRRQPDGTASLVLLDVPFAGGEFAVGGDARRPTLTVRYGQTTYVFERRGP